MVAEAAELLKDRGFTEQNVLVSASHTHAAPTGYFNFSTYNTVFMTTGTPTDQNVAGDRDPQLYAFMVRQLAEAIRRADDDLAPAQAGWSALGCTDVTRNRSIEAHLHNHGIVKAYGEGSPDEDPLGVDHTIDPDVHVLRVDKVKRTATDPDRHVGTFATHGTSTRTPSPSTTPTTTGRRPASPSRASRATGACRASQEVVNAYGNADEGDMCAGLDQRGPAWADEVGRSEADAMVERVAGGRAASMTAEPPLDSRWTRDLLLRPGDRGRRGRRARPSSGCRCSPARRRGAARSTTRPACPFEDRRAPVSRPAPGLQDPGRDARARGASRRRCRCWSSALGDRVIGSMPGEMTVGMGERVKRGDGRRGGRRHPP